MSLLEEPDFGTPARAGRGDRRASRSTGCRSTCRTAPRSCGRLRSAGVDIPKLCATDSLKAFGSCRLCLVEVDGRRGTPASCTTPCADGMVVRTQTPNGARAAPRTSWSSTSPTTRWTASPVRANGNCEMQAMAGAVGLRRGPLRLRGREPPRREQRPTATRTSPSTRPSASSAPAACGPAPRSRARSRSPSRAAASTRRSSPGGTDPSWTPSASRAAPACRPARRPPCRSSRSSSWACRRAR